MKTSPSIRSSISSRRHVPSAFTLIELLTVIAIIGILAAILIPTVTKVREQAKAQQCMAKMRTWGQAMMLYAQNNRGKYYALPNWSSPQIDTDEYRKPYRTYLNFSGSNTAKQFEAMRHCPSQNTADGAEELQSDGGTVPSYDFVIPTKDHNQSTSTGDFVDLSTAQAPSRLLIFVEGDLNAPIRNGGQLVAATTNLFKNSVTRHGKTIFGVFADVHVDRLTLTPTGSDDVRSIQKNQVELTRLRY